MADFQPYKPRKISEREMEDEGEEQFTRRFKRRRRAHQHSAASGHKGLIMSSMSGIGYRDFTLGPSRVFKSRTELDFVAYKSLPPISPRRTLNAEAGLPSLASCCIDVAAENYGDSSTWDSLDRFYHSHHADALVARVLDRSGQKQRLPFEVWATLGAVLGSQDMPRRWRTYRGLCLGDEDEIERLKQVNEAVRMDALIAPIASPGYFLAVLDITGARTFTDSDISKIKPLSPMLAALNLNGIDISDLGLRWIGSVASDSDCYRHLQVLSLKGCQRVTNDGVMKVMKLGLRMLDLRKTSATREIKNMLNMAAMPLGARAAWRPSAEREQLERPQIELELFGGSYSLSRMIAILHRLAQTPVRSSDAHIPLQKHLCVHIDSLSRSKAPVAPVATALKTAEELLHDQLTLISQPAKAIYNPAYGAITSTSVISREAFEDSAIAAAEKGAAFRMRDDRVAGGTYIGPDMEAPTSGRSLYDIGRRKLTSGGRPVDDVLSDTDEDTESERERQEHVKNLQREWDEAEADAVRSGLVRGPNFYQRPRPQDVPPKERNITVAGDSNLMLIRHLPYQPPWEAPQRPDHRKPTEFEARREPNIATANAPLQKKRRSTAPMLHAPVKHPSSSPTLLSSPSTSIGYNSSTPKSPAFASRPSASRSGTPVGSQARSRSVNPFAAKAARVLMSSAAKAPALPIAASGPSGLKSRSKLSAFQK